MSEGSFQSLHLLLTWLTVGSLYAATYQILEYVFEDLNYQSLQF
jgi:hypothetical protein